MFRFNESPKERTNNFKEEDGSLDIEATNILDDIIESKNFKLFHQERAREIKKELSIKEFSKYQLLIDKILERYRVNKIDIRFIGENLYEIVISEPENIRELKTGYAYKGGLARSVLEKELGIVTEISTRDTDLLRISREENKDEDLAMAKEYCPEDLEDGGHGVEKLALNYFETRDFTINELLVVGNKIILTKNCLLDTVRGIIRFSSYEKSVMPDSEDDYYNKGNSQTGNSIEGAISYSNQYKKDKAAYKEGFFVNDKLMAKALRLSALQSRKRKEAILIDDQVYQYLDINNFHIALHLDRALEQGMDVAEEYVQKLIEYGQIESIYKNDPKALLFDIIKMLQEDGSYIFRSERAKILLEEERMFTDFDKYMDLLKRAPKTRHIENLEEV